MRKIIFMPLLAAAIVAVVFFVVTTNKKSAKRVCFEKNCYEVELAATPAERTRGLMFRKSLDGNKGMLFEFEQDGIYPFWMKNTLIPLDIVWIDVDKRIVFISKNTLPCTSDPCPTVNPGKQARHVLELNAGEIGRIGAKLGDAVTVK